MTSPARSSRPELVAVRVPGAAGPWERVGLAGPPLTFEADRLALALHGLEPDADVDGLALEPSAEPPAREGRIDHVVALTDDFTRTRDRLVAAGLDHRRDRDAPDGRRQAFFVLGACLLELAGPADVAAPVLWGLTLVAGDLDAHAAHLGAIRDAVQPGRRIGTVRRDAGLPVPVALMTPRI